MEVLFHLISNVIYKCSRFFKVFLKKGLKFVLSRESSFIIFDLRFILLLAKVYYIFKK